MIAHPFTGDIAPFGDSELVGVALGTSYEAAVWPLFTVFIAGLEQSLPPATRSGPKVLRPTAKLRAQVAGSRADG